MGSSTSQRWGRRVTRPSACPGRPAGGHLGDHGRDRSRTDAQRDDAAGLDEVRRDVDSPAVDTDVAVVDLRSRAGRRRCRADARGVRAGSRRCCPAGRRPPRSSPETASHRRRRRPSPSASRAAAARTPKVAAADRGSGPWRGPAVAGAERRRCRRRQHRSGARPCDAARALAWPDPGPRGRFRRPISIRLCDSSAIGA